MGSILERNQETNCSDSNNGNDCNNLSDSNTTCCDHDSKWKEKRKVNVLEQYGYTLGRFIGSGTYATVKLAYSKRHECNVAIKIVAKKNYPTNLLYKYLPREINVIKELRHEHLIEHYEAIETSRSVYIVMEYAAIGSLYDYIVKNKQQNESIARKWFKELVSAVEYCHANGIVHRDLKCENVLLDIKFSIKLADFGLARNNMIGKNGTIKTSKTFCGTAVYASPEVLKNIPHRPNTSDIWSIGVVLYCIVFGTLPFDDSGLQGLIEQVEKKLTFPQHITISDGCKQMITKLIAPLEDRLSISEIKNQPWYRDSNTVSTIR
ncbi:Protein kinase, ATP binding site,Protein kinase-like domain,Serine/threonine-protein kinase, active [Cinara cedri]|uniref:Protein kinase, ATP binding site,Protein kinase-like domain,Serine/threonine-protein kinase, active n=1 Tax=Cinara cedri TaxID=506608 RepID=A0A5E4N104_9HEMI|nr:Protein kinase, ATP binding site,Protein kinase-like domain,Serine/threonine-protein kinase, active [Cinara cedri]